MNILITGGAGFLGSHLCRRLLKEGNSITCIDNLITGSEDNIKDLLKNKKFTFIKHDIAQSLKIDGKLDWVMHFASLASPFDYLKHPIKTLKVGTLGTYNCLGIAQAKNAKLFLASTSEVYGDPKISPQPEEYWGNVNPIGPRSCYDESKRAAEALTFAYYRQNNVAIHVIRIFNTYGPNMRIADGRVVSNFIVQALKGDDLTVYGKGNQTRSFCYVDDLIEGICRYMKVDYSGPLNLGTTFEFTILELAKKVIKLTGTKSRIKFESLPVDDPKQRRPDNSKAKKLLGWTPKVTLEQGLKKTIPYFRKVLSL
ncbi:MAG: SDR family oxidoreductase [Candidatus Omnitrophica bacterium]|jgi:dTDP-glucose 4,6-dehydratase|nr:SDR family oxidoreductase [Candidatus Omnitrophota bacterium]